MTVWTSLDLTVDTAALPSAVQDTLRDRWATPAPPEGHYPVTAGIGDFPDLPGNARPVTVSNATTNTRTGMQQVQVGDALLHIQPDRATLTLRRPELPEVTALLLMAELHRARGWLPLHASTVARDSQAVGITGPSGAGKSTAALRLSALGFQLLAEDQTWIHPATRRVQGLDRWLRAYPDSLERFAPHLLPESYGKDAFGKHLLPLSRAAPATLKALLLLGQPRDLPASQVTRLLWEATGVPLLPGSQQETARAIGHLIRSVGIHGTDREKLVEQVKAHLRPVQTEERPGQG